MTARMAALIAPILLLAACSEPAPGGATDAGTPPPVAVNPPPLEVPPLTASSDPAAQAIDQAAWTAEPPKEGTARRDSLIRAQVLLARAQFSPGVIDGQMGDNMKDALRAFEEAHGLPADGELDDQSWAALTQDTGPVMTDYTITKEDVAGPFVDKIPDDYKKLAELKALGFTSPREALAEKFHMGEDLLAALNPDADFGKAGTKIVVAAPGPQTALPKVTRIEVDKAKRQVRAYAGDGKLVATYPATVGSSDMPTPSGTWDVTAVAFDPTWTYDPSKLHFGDRKAGKLTIAAGPNNPVGDIWIDLSKDTYGIHGASEPKTVGKAASHGCVRLTNWDARQLGKAVSKGTQVVFVESAKGGAAKT